MSSTTVLTIGSKVRFDGESWTVSGLSGQTVHLTHPIKAPIVMRTTDMLAAPGFGVVGIAADPQEGLGTLFSALSPDAYRLLLEREAHLLELLTGYRRGSAELALPNEPRSPYAPGSPVTVRYEFKAAELGVSMRTVQRMVADYQRDGIAGLVSKHSQRHSSGTGRVDDLWISTAREVLEEHIDASQPTVQLVIDRINARVRAENESRAVVSEKAVKIPSESTARRVLAEISNGQQAFAGSSAKQKRSIAGRPSAPYGRLRAQRVGEYVLLDTSPLDVFAMHPITLKWVGLQLTVAMDLGSRCITGMRLSPVSANAVDAALVLYETINPRSRLHTSVGLLPYGGIPDTIFLPESEDQEVTVEGLPGTQVGTVVIDHGKMYMSEHIRAVCDRLGISIQPARVLTSTDKAPIERFFRTIREDLLVALPGYKGPDVYSRGKNVEDTAFYFTHELEGLIRDWIINRYHKRPHHGLRISSVPGLEMSPNEMWDNLVASGGNLLIPRRSDLVYDFLPVKWRTLQHYGVEVNGMRYDGPALNGLRGTSSPYAHQKGAWPIRFDPDDATCVYFQRPDDLSWSVLRWEHATDVIAPFSVETMRYARRLATHQGQRPDDRLALAELLERWDAGHLLNPTERRLALRLAEQRKERLEAEEARANKETDATASAEDQEPEDFLGGDSLRVDPCLESDDDGADEIDDDYYGDALEAG